MRILWLEKTLVAMQQTSRPSITGGGYVCPQSRQGSRVKTSNSSTSVLNVPREW